MHSKLCECVRTMKLPDRQPVGRPRRKGNTGSSAALGDLMIARVLDRGSIPLVSTKIASVELALIKSFVSRDKLEDAVMHPLLFLLCDFLRVHLDKSLKELWKSYMLEFELKLV